jgi:DNA-binding NarL/FixJ family response regulator
MTTGHFQGRPSSAELDGPAIRSRLSVVPDRFSSDANGHLNGPAQRRVKVLVAGGDVLLADSLAIALGSHSDIEVVGTETDLNLAPNRVRRNDPDVVLLNNFVANRDCADVINRFRLQSPEVKVIVLTSSTSEDDDELLACVQAGASGHQTTDRQPTELVDSIKRVHAGELVFAPDVLVNLVTRPRTPVPARPPEGPAQALAPRELQVLQTVATGMSTGEAATSLGITVHTVRAHLKNVMTKLQAHSKLEAVIFALKKGLIQLPE